MQAGIPEKELAVEDAEETGSHEGHEGFTKGLAADAQIARRRVVPGGYN